MGLSSRRLTSLVLLLLAASLGGNAYLYFLPSAPEPGAAKTVAPGPPAQEPSELGCAAELEACRRAAATTVHVPWGGALLAMSAQPGSPAAPAEPHPAADPRGSLCRIARDNMKMQWLEKRDVITAVLSGYLIDNGRQKEDAQRDADRAADTLNLQGSGRRGFEADFLDLRGKRMADLAAAAQSNPPDWSRLLSSTRTMFDGEDALIQTQLGADALARYRDSEADRRMTVLSIMATYADADWDQNVVP